MLLYSQAATTRALMPLGIALGIPPQFLIAMFPSVNGYFFIPTYGSLIAAINFDLSGTTKIGKYVLNHSFMIPGLVATAVAVTTGLLLAKVMFSGEPALSRLTAPEGRFPAYSRSSQSRPAMVLPSVISPSRTASIASASAQFDDLEKFAVVALHGRRRTGRGRGRSRCARRSSRCTDA